MLIRRREGDFGLASFPRGKCGKKHGVIRIVRYTKDIRRAIVQGSFLETAPAEGKVRAPRLKPEAGAMFR